MFYQFLIIDIKLTFLFDLKKGDDMKFINLSYIIVQDLDVIVKISFNLITYLLFSNNNLLFIKYSIVLVFIYNTPSLFKFINIKPIQFHITVHHNLSIIILKFYIFIRFL